MKYFVRYTIVRLNSGLVSVVRLGISPLFLEFQSFQKWKSPLFLEFFFRNRFVWKYLIYFITGHHWSPKIGQNSIFDIISEFSLKFRSKWYVTCQISNNLDFSTSHDHRLVMTGRSKRLETPSIGLLVLILPKSKWFYSVEYSVSLLVV